MTLIYSLLIEHDFHIAGESEYARLPTMIRESDATNLNVILWGNADRGAQNNIAVLPLELNSMRQKGNLTSLSWHHRWLWRGRPKLGVEAIFNVDPVAPVIHDRVAAPTVQFNIIPAAKAR